MSRNASVDRVLVFLDVAGAASLWSRDPETMRRALDTFHRVVRDRAAAFDGGEATPLGAGLISVWSSAVRAVRFCMAVQEGLAAATWPAELLEQPEASVVHGPAGTPLMSGLRCRVGVHCGVPWERVGVDGERVLDGAAVRRAVRVARAAHGGQVLVTEPVFRQIDASTGGDLVVFHLGDRPLRGVPGSIDLFDVRSAATVGRSFPAPRTRDVERTNYRPERDAFVGRSSDLAALEELIDGGVRCVTLVGKGGSGRRRLLSSLLLRILPSWVERGGAWVIDAAGVRDLEHFLCEAATALDVDLSSHRSAQDAVQHLSRAFADRRDMLLVVQGLPAWTPEIRAVVTAWLRRLPRLRLLATADDRVGLDGEITYRIGPQGTPGTGLTLRDGGVRLFLRRVRESGRDVEANERPAVLRLVAAAEGSALAIELLAGRFGTQPASELEESLSAAKGATAIDRVLAVCLTDLPTWMRSALQRLAVIDGPFSLDAAHAVAELSDWAGAPSTRDAVEMMRERGFIGRSRSTDDAVIAEYDVHPAVRDFLRETSSELETASAIERYGRYAVAAAAPWVDEVPGAHGAEALSALSRYRGALVAAFAFGTERAGAQTGALDLAMEAVLALDALQSRQGLAEAHEARLDAVIEAAQTVSVKPRRLILALRARARARYLRSGIQGARDDLEQARAIGERTSDAEGEGIAVGTLGQLLAVRGQLGEAVEYLQRALKLLVSAQAPRETAAVRAALGSALTHSGEQPAALAHLAAAVRGFAAVGDRHNEALALTRLGTVQRRMGQLDAARNSLEQAVAAQRAEGNQRREAEAREQLAAVFAHRGDLEASMATFQSARALAHVVGDRRMTGRIGCRQGMVWLEQGDEDAAREAFYEALALGTDVGSSSVEALAHGGLGLLLHRNGSTRDGMEHFRQALERSRYRVEPRVETVLTAMMAVCQAELGDRDEAQRFSDRLLGCMSEADDRWIDAAGTMSMAWIDAELCNWDEPSEERFNTALLRFDGAEDVPLVVRALGEAAIRRYRAATFR